MKFLEGPPKWSPSAHDILPYRSWTVLTLRCSLCRSDSQTFLQDRSRIVLKALPCESPLIGRAQEPEGVTTCLLKRLQRAKDPKSGVSNDLMCILHAGVLVYSCVLLWLEDLARLGQGMGWYGAKIGADVQQGHSKNQDKEETGHSGGHRQHADASATRFWHRFKIALPAASPPACKHPDHQGPAPHTQNLENLSQPKLHKCPHWCQLIEQLMLLQSTPPNHQLLDHKSCNSLACVSFSSSSTSSKIALKHLGPHSGTFASLTMASDLSHSLACGRPASQPDSKLFKIFQNMSQHVSTIFKNNIVSSSFYAHWQTCHRD